MTLWPAAPAAAHGIDPVAGTNYRTAITSVSRTVPGLSVRTVKAGARLELTNHTGRTVEVIGSDGKPQLRVGPDSVVRWHDHRVHWMNADPPPQVRADPSRMHRIRDWVIPLRVDASTVEVRGTLDWLPPPEAGTWWALCLVGAAAVAGLGMWLRGSGAAVARAGVALASVVLAGVALAGGVVGVGYAVGRELDAGTTGVAGLLRGLLTGQPWLVLTSLAAVAAAAYALRGAVGGGPGGAGRPSADFALALAGACLLVSAGVPNAAVFSRAVAPVPWDGTWARTAVAAIVVAGAGLTAAGVLRMRSASREAARERVRDKVPG
jgi:hypothetical protein